jgi:lipopolysaccharide heptosyltransferase II
MSLPALRQAGPHAVIVARTLAPLLDLAQPGVDIIPIDRGAAGLAPVARRVRRGRYQRGILLTPSFSSALLLRMSGVSWIRGSATDRRSALLTERVSRSAIDMLHRSSAYWLLAAGEAPESPPVPRVSVSTGLADRWRDRLGQPDGRTIGIFPGGNASSRRWPVERFAEVATQLSADGHTVVVFGGPAERDLTRRVALGHAIDCGGRTDLPLLAAALAACDILVTNDSGPMHLAAAVGTTTVSLWGAGNPGKTGPVGDEHKRLRRADLPCVPCVKNVCPRHGAGFILSDAERECLALIEPADVVQAVREALA